MEDVFKVLKVGFRFRTTAPVPVDELVPVPPLATGRVPMPSVYTPALVMGDGPPTVMKALLEVRPTEVTVPPPTPPPGGVAQNKVPPPLV